MEGKVITNIEEGQVLDWTKLFPVFVITKSGNMNIQSENAIAWVANSLGKPAQYLSSAAFGIPTSRNIVYQLAKQYYGTSRMRALWIDSDIVIMTPREMAEAIKYADIHDLNLVANYKGGSMLTNIRNVMYKEYKDNSNYTDEELEQLENYAPITGYAGLGWYYGWHDLDYVFHADTTGEDFYFFSDQKIRLNYAKNVKLMHMKQMFI